MLCPTGAVGLARGNGGMREAVIFNIIYILCMRSETLMRCTLRLDILCIRSVVEWLSGCNIVSYLMTSSKWGTDDDDSQR